MSKLNSVHFLSEKAGIAFGNSGTILKTTDAGENWGNVESGTREHLNAADFLDEKTGWAVGNNGTVLKTVDGGESWGLKA